MSSPCPSSASCCRAKNSMANPPTDDQVTCLLWDLGPGSSGSSRRPELHRAIRLLEDVARHQHQHWEAEHDQNAVPDPASEVPSVELRGEGRPGGGDDGAVDDEHADDAGER